MADQPTFAIGDWVRDQRDGQLGRITSYSADAYWRDRPYRILALGGYGDDYQLEAGHIWALTAIVATTPTPEEELRWMCALLSQ